MKIAIVGAGVSGLASARRAVENNLQCTVFEMTASIGGIWVYTENTDKNEFINPTYASLRANLPVHLMEFFDYKFHHVDGSSYPYREDVLKYLKDFVKDYDLLQYIKFYHKVLNVSRLSDTWSITVQNLKGNVCENYNFDSVMICSGHNSKPYISNIPGIETFKGFQMHSYHYRNNNSYRNKRVLIVGSGASGLDISLECSEVATLVFLSCGSNITKSELAKNIIKKGKVVLINGNIIFFDDNSSTYVDDIIYCTGYLHDYPFLDSTCKIEVINGKILQPLFKSFISIPFPSMCFIGLLQSTIIFPIVDLQAAVFMQILTNRITLPSTEKMLESLEKEKEQKTIENEPKTHYFYLGTKMQQYFEDVAHFGNINMFLPPVLYKMYKKNVEIFRNDYKNLKKIKYTIVDNENFLYDIKSEK